MEMVTEIMNSSTLSTEQKIEAVLSILDSKSREELKKKKELEEEELKKKKELEEEELKKKKELEEEELKKKKELEEEELKKKNAAKIKEIIDRLNSNCLGKLKFWDEIPVLSASINTNNKIREKIKCKVFESFEYDTLEYLRNIYDEVMAIPGDLAAEFDPERTNGTTIKFRWIYRESIDEYSHEYILLNKEIYSLKKIGLGRPFRIWIQQKFFEAYYLRSKVDSKKRGFIQKCLEETLAFVKNN